VFGLLTELLQPSWGGHSHVSSLQDRARPMDSHPSWGPALRSRIPEVHGVVRGGHTEGCLCWPLPPRRSSSGVRVSAAPRVSDPSSPWAGEVALGDCPVLVNLVLAQRGPLLGTITHRWAARGGMSPPAATGHRTTGPDGQGGGFGVPRTAGAAASLAVGAGGLRCSLSSLLSHLRAARADG